MGQPGSTSTHVSTSAPPRVAAHVRAARDGDVRVLHRTPAALYLEVAGRCVGVVAPAAAQVPCALRLAPATASGPGVSLPAVLAAERPSPYVVRGTLYVAGIPLPVGRFVDVRVPRITPTGVSCRAAGPTNAESRPPRPVSAGPAALDFPAPGTPSAHSGLPARIDEGLLARLVGRGSGLTPLGDDVLCGWLAVLVACDRLEDAVSDDVRRHLDRTTLLSATLIECALHGEVLPEFATYLTALDTPAEAGAARALERIGHTSGAGLLLGARHALDTLTREAAAA